jgi:hypothetical protein
LLAPMILVLSLQTKPVQVEIKNMDGLEQVQAFTYLL